MAFLQESTLEAASLRVLRLLNLKHFERAPQVKQYCQLEELWLTESSLPELDGASLPSQLRILHLYDNRIATVSRTQTLTRLEVRTLAI